MLAANRRKLLGSWMSLAEVDTKSALSLVKLLHVSSPLMRRPCRWGNFRAVAPGIAELRRGQSHPYLTGSGTTRMFTPHQPRTDHAVYKLPRGRTPFSPAVEVALHSPRQSFT